MSQANTKATRHRVLIVDDEESMRLLLARILVNGLKVEVTLAGTCEQALRLAGNYAYDAILLDLLMPGIGGFEVLREIRRASPNVATPVIIVSVLSDQATRDRCMRAGASAYVVKPVERNALVATVKAQIAARSTPKNARKVTMAEIRIENVEALGKPLGQYSHMTRVKGATETLYIAGMLAPGRRFRRAMQRRIPPDRNRAQVRGRRLGQRGAVHHLPRALAGHPEIHGLAPARISAAVPGRQVPAEHAADHRSPRPASNSWSKYRPSP